MGTARRPPTPAVAGARRYAARVRTVLGLTGCALVAADPTIQPRPAAALIGCAVICLTGIVEMFSESPALIGAEEVLSCAAVIGIVGLGEGRVTAVTLIWLAAAAVGVLARGGRVGGLARFIVIASIAAPIVAAGRITGEEAGLAVGSLALLLAVGRISRETSRLLCDPLTGALTRVAFRAQVDREAGRARPSRPATVIMIDLDDFGVVNKRRGYAAGDQLLLSAAAAMAAALGPSDLISRLGGDEFAVLTLDSRPAALAQRLIDAAGAAGARACAGVSAAPADGSSADALLHCADFALRMAKRAGKSRVSTFRGGSLSSGDAGTRATLERICRGDGVVIGLQPIFDLRTGSEHAYEALAHFPVGNRVDPLFWLTLADSLGMRPELEFTCLRKSLELAGALPKGARLGVNLSAPMLEREDVRELLRGCRALPQLILEVGAEKLLAGEPGMADAVRWLRGQGVGLAVDNVDMGTADVAQLAVIRPGYIKLDRHLVAGLDLDPQRARLVEALADLGRSCGAHVVAVGVERPGELDAVLRAGVTFAQGDLLAPLISREALTDVVTVRDARPQAARPPEPRPTAAPPAAL